MARETLKSRLQAVNKPSPHCLKRRELRKLFPQKANNGTRFDPLQVEPEGQGAR